MKFEYRQALELERKRLPREAALMQRSISQRCDGETLYESQIQGPQVLELFQSE